MRVKMTGIALAFIIMVAAFAIYSSGNWSGKKSSRIVVVLRVPTSQVVLVVQPTEGPVVIIAPPSKKQVTYYKYPHQKQRLCQSLKRHKVRGTCRDIKP